MKASQPLRLGVAVIACGASLHARPPAALHASDCAGCHDSGPRAAKRQPGVPPGFHAAALKASPHAGLECTACHSQITEGPHPDKLAPVDCGDCYPDEQAQYATSVHGRIASRGDSYAPGCKTCHGTHNILRPSQAGSPTSTIEIPRWCGGCHREGTPVSQTADSANAV